MKWLFCCPSPGEALSNLDVQSGRRQALAVVLSQGGLGTIVAIVCLAGWGARAGASALLGTGIGVAATSLMAFALLRHGENATAARVAWGFFSGWLVKVGFTVALLVMAFRSQKVDAVPLLAAYFATFLGYWLGAARTGGRPDSKP
jgi:F0F1-type ATP synthase assembly protein I